MTLPGISQRSLLLGAAAGAGTPEGYPSFSGYQSSAWDRNTRRPTAAMEDFLNV